MRILVVEDDPKIAQFLKSSFEAENFAVDIALDGEKGSFLARTNDYDMVILDNMLPKKEGREVCREIREKKNGIKILILSAQSEIPIKVSLFDCGADDYVTKPFSFSELLARVKSLLRRPEAIVDEILRIGDLEVNTKNYQVKKNKREICLTRKEFMLLELLLRNRNKVISRGMIVEHVWDMNMDPFSNTIETHIRNLRYKLGNNCKNKLIETISGRGYIIR